MSAPIGFLDVSGSTAGGRLDSIGVTIGGVDAPLGDSGFFVDSFGGQAGGQALGFVL
jgi:hypothetical protein